MCTYNLFKMAAWQSLTTGENLQSAISARDLKKHFLASSLLLWQVYLFHGMLQGRGFLYKIEVAPLHLLFKIAWKIVIPNSIYLLSSKETI